MIDGVQVQQYSPLVLPPFTASNFSSSNSFNEIIVVSSKFNFLLFLAMAAKVLGALSILAHPAS